MANLAPRSSHSATPPDGTVAPSTGPSPGPIDREEARRPRWEALQQRTLQRIVILGAGFGGMYTALRLEKIFRRHTGVEITLVSRDNYFLMTPFLFEAGSGVLEPRHAVNPLRPMFQKVRFVEADIERVDFDHRIVHATHAPGNHNHQLPYDHLVIALGGVTNRRLVPGSEHALGFKTLSDAIFLRNSVIDLFERADVEEDPDVRRRLLTFVIIGGGLVGVELMGELTEFVRNLLRNYRHIPREFVRFILIEAHDRILPEMEEDQARYATDILWRRGCSIITGTRVQLIDRGRVHLPPQGAAPAIRAAATGTSLPADPHIIEAQTILLTAGVEANPLLATFPVEKAKNGRMLVESSMRCKARPEVWALGDCALIPDKNGKPYPPLAQHALREARVLADNIAAVINSRGRAEVPLEPFLYETMGMLASLGNYRGVGRVLRFKLRGFPAWWVWRTYYLFQMPRLQRKIRVMMDWTIALLFRNDVVKLDLFGEEHPTRKMPPSAPRSASPLVPPP